MRSIVAKTKGFYIVLAIIRFFLLSLPKQNLWRMLVGRKKEIDTLEKAYKSDESEFVAVYGRRRIGKTYLVREIFGNKFTFQYTGIHNRVYS